MFNLQSKTLQSPVPKIRQYHVIEYPSDDLPMIDPLDVNEKNVGSVAVVDSKITNLMSLRIQESESI